MTFVIDAHLHCTGQERIADAMQTLDEAEIDIGVLLALSVSDGLSLNDLDSLERAYSIVPMQHRPLWDSIQTAVTLVRAQPVDLLHAHVPNAHVPAGLVGPGGFENIAARPVRFCPTRRCGGAWGSRRANTHFLSLACRPARRAWSN